VKLATFFSEKILQESKLLPSLRNFIYDVAPLSIEKLAEKYDLHKQKGVVDWLILKNNVFNTF